MFKFRTPHISKEGSIFSWTALIYGFGVGLLLPIFPDFVEGVIDNEAYVGFFYSAMSIAMILAGVFSTYLFRRFSRLSVVNLFLILGAIVTMFLVFVTEFYELFGLSFIKVFAGLFVTMSLSLMVHDFTASRNLGKTEGVFFLFNNIGWFIGPFIGGTMARYIGYEPVFALAGFTYLVSLVYLAHQKLIKNHAALNVPKKSHVKHHSWERFKEFFTSPALIGSYLVATGLMLWSSFKVVFVPLFIINMGYASDTAGLVISLSIIPFLLFEVPVGKYSDKHGLKKPIALGFFIVGFFLLGVMLSPYFFLDVLFLILANIGASFIEPLHDVYFFRNVTKKTEEDYYGIFITADPVAKFIGPAIISVSLLLLPFDWVFAVFGAIFFVAAAFSLKIKH